MEDKHRSNLTEGSVPKQLTVFAMPLLVAQVLQALYNVADMFIVGQYMGDAGITAVSNSTIMMHLITFIVSGFAMSGTVLVAQYVGADREEDAGSVIGTVFTLFIFLSIIITVLGLVFAPNILHFLNTPAESQQEALGYLRICFAGTIFVAGYNAVSAVLRGLGDSKRPLLFVAVAAVVNIILDYIFVGPLHMGAAGAALATILAQGLSFVLAVFTLKRQKFVFDFHPKSFRIDKTKVLPVLKIALPSVVQSTVVNFSYMLVTSNVNAYGLAAATAFSVCAKVDSFAFLPTMAISQAVSAMAGQNLGAGKPERAAGAMKSGILLSLLITLPILLIVRTQYAFIVGIFGCGADSIAVSAMYVKYVTHIYLLNAIIFNINGLANGSGNSIFAMINAVCSLVITRIALIYIFTRMLDFGLFGVFLAMGLCPLVAVVTGSIFYLSGRWKRSRLIDVA